MDGETLLAHADGALYCSKKNGRNMVTRHGSGTEEGAAAERLLTAPLAR
jgi:hypothetical protein